MKSLITFTLLLFWGINITAQSNITPQERYTYIWDVTRSMVGYGKGNPDIYDRVRDIIIKDMESIPENNGTEICIIAFRGKLDGKGYKVTSAPADKAGKRKLKDWMRGIVTTEESVGNTNTYTALKYAVDNVFAASTVDYVKIMTDGGCDEFAALKNLLSRWCEIKEKKNVHAYYITLTENAKNKATGKAALEEHVDPLCFSFVDEIEAIDQVRQLTLTDGPYYYNLLTDNGEALTYKFKVSLGDGKITPGFRIHCKTQDNGIFEIDETVPFDASTGCITLTPKIAKDAQHALGYNEQLTVKLEFTPAEDNDKSFRYVMVKPKEHYIVLKTEQQELNLATGNVEYNVRNTEGKISLQLNCSTGEIKPGYKVDYRIEDPKNLITGTGTAEVGPNMQLSITPNVNPEARDADVLKPGIKHDGARVILKASAKNGDGYKNVLFKNTECDITLVNNTHRKVKIYVE